MVHLGWATQILAFLLREENANALLGDLWEEYESRSSFVGRHEARRCYRREIYRSIAAALRLQVVELVRSAPWGIAIGSYVLVGVSQFALTLMLSRIWPEAAQTTSALSIVVVSPVVAFIAYVAARFNRAAPFFLAAMMFLVAACLIAITTETISTAFTLAFLILGPLAAVLGGSLCCTRERP